jgi:two-component system, OmpR family, sensor histidine kinase KdpD
MGSSDPGKLRIYLGSAAGVGKTYAMLCEGHRRAERGTDVVIGFAETHGREHTAELIEGLEVVPRARLPYRGTFFEEMDLDAVLARDTLIRRAARIAARSSGGDLLAVHVTRSDGLTGADPAALAAQRRLVESLGGSYHQVVGDDIPQALLTFARAENATQLVLGASRRSWLSALLTGPGFGARTIRGSGDIDVHIVTHSHMGRGRGLPRAGGGLTLRRQLAGYLLAAVLAPVLTVALTSDRGGLNLISDVLVYLVAVIVVALVGGFVPAVLLAIASSLLLNYYFTPPIHLWTIAEANNALALGVFVVVALLVSTVVDMAARRTRQAARASAESALLATTAGDVLAGQRPVEAVLDRVREAFGMDSVTLLERGGDGSAPASPAAAWTVAAHSGPEAVARPDEADVEVPVGRGLRLALRGRTLTAADHRVLNAFAAYAAVALEQQRLAAETEAARPIAEADRMRTALLTAVSHDLRTPLASAKAAVTSLRSADVTWDAADREELLATADESLDKLTRLVGNLLDMSRLQAGALAVFSRPAGLDEVVASALDQLGPASEDVIVDIPDTLPAVQADPAILERVIANLTSNALRYSPPGKPPLLAASALGDRVELRVVDQGPGISAGERDRVFVPFQRLGDTDNTTGVGLGLALSRGLTEVMGGTLDPEETPGGGLTMIISLPAAPQDGLPAEAAPGLRERNETGSGPGTPVTRHGPGIATSRSSPGGDS